MKPSLVSLQANLEVPMGSGELAKIIYDAIIPETRSAPSDRAEVKVSVRSSVLFLEISAEDLTALRAAMNSYLAWISGCMRTVESVASQNP